MPKKNDEVLEFVPPRFERIVRMVVPVPHRSLSDKIETVQNQGQSVKNLYDDYVLGRLDPRQLGGGEYDPDDSEEIDPLNTSGLTFEEATQISDAGRRAAAEMKQRRTVPDHPIESSEQQVKEKQREPKED